MSSQGDQPVKLTQVRLWAPGSRTRAATRVSIGILFIFLTISGFISVLPTGRIVQATPDNSLATSPSVFGSQLPQVVGADSVPALVLPKTVVSNVEEMIGQGGLIRDSPENMTIYNLGIRMRLLGGILSYDELLGTDLRPSPRSLWSVEASIGNIWVPLLVRSSNFTLQGTNATGTYVTRTMSVGTGLYSGILRIVYHATSTGALKWSLEFVPDGTGIYRLSYKWWNITATSKLSMPSKFFSVDYGSANYTLSWNDIPTIFNSTASRSSNQFSLLVNLGTLQTGSIVYVDPTITPSTISGATDYSFQRKVFYEPKGHRFWAFFNDGNGIKYSNSLNGINWSWPQPMPPGWPSYPGLFPEDFAPTIYSSGSIVVVATGNHTDTTVSGGQTASASVSFVIGTISGSQISWSQVYAAGTRFFACGFNSCQLKLGYRLVSVTLGSDGHVAMSANWYLNLRNGCNGGFVPYSESLVVAVYRGYPLVADGESGCGTFDGDKDRSVVMPSDSLGSIRILYQIPIGSVLQLRTRLLYGSPTSQTVIPNADSYTNSSLTGNPAGSSQNYGSSNLLWLKNLNLSNSHILEQDFAFLKFNLPTISSGQFYSAVLSLKFRQGTCCSSNVFLASVPASGDWNENTITYQNEPGGQNPASLTEVGVVSTVSAGPSCQGCANVTRQYDITPTIVGMYRPPGDMNGWQNYGIVLFTSDPVHSTIESAYSRDSGSPPALNVTFSCCMGTSETIEPNLFYISSPSFDPEFSAVSDANYGIHVAYQGGKNDNLTYAYKSATDAPWVYSPNLATALFNPTLTIDYSTNSIYLFYISGSSIAMRTKSSTQQWNDTSLYTPVTGRNGPRGLGSNLASISSSNSSSLALVWTENCPNGPYCVIFASIPIQTVWSPYSTPRDPWDGNGLAPYGQYFANLGEYVSSSNGMLTVRQTDLTLQGRGLNLEITRVYTEPQSFLNGAVYNYETYPWAPMGDGWQLNFPWMNNSTTSNPAIIHLWDGEGYRIPTGFWTGSTAFYENDQGEHFKFYKYSNGTLGLYASSGIEYFFDSGHRLRRITDTYANEIGFNYTGVYISSVTDTVGRTFLFCYTGGLLTSVEQSSTSCGIGFSRRILYRYGAGSLVSVTDSAGRITSLSYNATSGSTVSPWLLSRIAYPTGWYSNYTFSPMLMGTQASSYQVIQQLVETSSNQMVKRFTYRYVAPAGDQVTNAIVLSYNGTSTIPASNTTYAFSFAGVAVNVTDGHNNFLHGLQQLFGVQGEIPRETSLVPAANPWYGTTTQPGSGWNSSPSYNLDSTWGFSNVEGLPSMQPWGTVSGWNDTGARWIWTSPNAYNGAPTGSSWFRTVFTLQAPVTVNVELRASYNFTLYLDGSTYPGWSGTGSSTRYTILGLVIQPGTHVLAVKAYNPPGEAAGLILSIKDTSVNQILVRTGVSLGSYTDYYQYDLWGNRIYSRRAINPSIKWFHESFSSYYNDGLPTGFRAFQETFSQNNGTRTDNPWSVYNGTWTVHNGVYNGTSLASSPNNQNFFAWTDIGESDISVTASIQVTAPVISYPRIGLISHWIGYGLYKWALVLNTTAQGVNLALLDDGGAGMFASSFCTNSISPGSWYSFNFTMKGTSAWGKVGLPNGTPCAVSGTFPPNSQALTTTGFGLYAGGYKALFDNVTAYRVSPGLTGTSFSNSFYTNGAPGGNIHSALAGTAELQNGTGTPPIETYFNYSLSGAQIQRKQIYLPNGPAQWLTTTQTYDNFGNMLSSTDLRGNSTTYAYSSNYKSAYLTSVTHTLKPEGNSVTSTYTYNFTTGTTLSITDPNGHTTNHVSDVLGRLTRTTYPTGDFESYLYNDTSNYVTITNKNGWITQQVYDGLGRLASTKRFLGGIIYSNETYTYNWQDKIISHTDQLSNVYSYQYDSVGRNTLLVEPDGNTTQVSYNDLQSSVISVNEQGAMRCSIYDRLGRLVSVIEYAYQNCNPLSLAGATYVTNYYYDEVGNLLKSTPANYNLFVNPGFETDDFTGWTETGTTISIDHPHSGVYEASSDIFSTSMSLQQNFTSPVPPSNITKFQLWYKYGDNAIYAEVLFSNGAYSQQVLPYVSQWTQLNIRVGAGPGVNVIGIKIVNTSGSYKTLQLDDFLLSTSGPTGYNYDNLNRVVQATYPDGTSGQYVYDNSGNMVQGTDRNGVRTSYSYDSLNRLLSITYHTTPVTSDNYTYDNNSNLLTLKSQNATLGYTYDSRNRVTCETYSINAGIIGGPCGVGGGGSVAAGTLITMADRSTMPVQNLLPGMRLLSYNVTTGQYTDSVVTRMQTVQTNNMLVIRTQDTEVLRTDNATIQKLWIKKANGVTGWFSVTQLRVGDYLFKTLDQRWTMVTNIQYIPGSFTMYDVYTSAPYDYVANGFLDPPKLPQSPSSPTPSGTVGIGYSFSYYYSGEELVQTTYSDNMAVNLAYDGLGRVVNASTIFTQTLKVTYAKFSYYANDQLRGVQYGNGLIANYTYDKNLRPLQINLMNGTITPLVLNYQYDKTGTLHSVQGQIRNVTGTSVPFWETYSYDPLQRLTNSTTTVFPATTNLWYEYDSLGNRIAQAINVKKSSGWTLTTYNYNQANNELARTITPSNTTTYGYDGNGNLVSQTLGASTWTYTWNAQGQLMKAGNSSGVQSYYAYDGLGRRVEAKEGSLTTFYAHEGPETLAEEYPAAPANDYVYASGLRIAKVNGGQSLNPTVTYYHTDALGSTRMVTSASKTILFSDTYLPYGQESGTQTGSESYRFTGKQYSSATGLYYDYQRWYDPSVGRFISQDPVAGFLSSPQSLNPYVYVSDTPTTFTDPSGMDSQSDQYAFSDHPYGECGWTSWGGCIYNSINAGGEWYSGLSPEDKQIVTFSAAVVLTLATGGEAAPTLLLVGEAGFVVGAGVYTGYEYATRGTPTLIGALEWGNIGFGAALAVYGGYQVASSIAARAGEDSLIDASFASRFKTFSHWIRHGIRMGDFTPGAYVQSARSLIEEGYSGEAELWIQGSGTDLYAVEPGTGRFAIYNPVKNLIRTYYEHSGGYEWILNQIKFQGWKRFPIA